MCVHDRCTCHFAWDTYLISTNQEDEEDGQMDWELSNS